MNKKGLLKLLHKHDLKGLGGIFLEDVQESLPKCDKVVRLLLEEDKIVLITRPVDKKKVLFYRDHTSDFDVDEDFRKLWRSTAVDGLDERKIDEYLEKQGIRGMQDQGPRRPMLKKGTQRRKGRRKPAAPKDNEHLADVLENYDEMTADKGDK